MENAIPAISNKIKIKADMKRSDQLTDCATGSRIKLRQKDSFKFDVLLLDNGKIADVSSISTLTIDIFDIGNENSPLPRTWKLETTLQADSSEINQDLTDGDSLDDVSHATLYLNGNATFLGEGPKYLRICAFGSDSSCITFAEGWVDVLACANPPDVSENAPAVYMTATECGNLFAAKTANLSDLSDKSVALTNLDGVSQSEFNQLKGIVSAHDFNESNFDGLYFKSGYLKGSAPSSSFTGTFPISICFTLKFDKDTHIGNYETLFSNIYYASSRYNGLRIFLVYNQGNPSISYRLGDYVNSTYMKNIGIPVNEDGTIKAGIYPFVLSIVCEGNSVYKFTICSQKVHSFKGSIYAETAGTNYYAISPLSEYQSDALPTVYHRLSARLSRFAIFNYDLFASDVPYSENDYLDGVRVPTDLFDAASTKRALLFLENYTILVGSTKICPDISGNMYDASVYGNIVGTADASVARLASLINSNNI